MTSDSVLSNSTTKLAEDRRRIRSAIAAFATFVATILFYESLYGELPYHDVGRFVFQIESNRYFWDMGHVWLQPLTLLWHRYLGFGETAEASQKHINTVFAAAGVAIFYLTLRRTELPPWQQLAATILVAASNNILMLAPTAHMKLLAFPFLTGAFSVGVMWEHSLSRTGRALVGLGLLLAAASALHSSCLAAAPFVAGAILLSVRRRGGEWRSAFTQAILFSVVCGLTFLLLLELARVLFFGQLLDVQIFSQTVAEKDALRTGFFSVADTVERMVFSTANDFIAAPDLGSLISAWFAGQITTFAPYARELALEGLPWIATLALIGFIYLAAIRKAILGAPLLMPLAFAIGSFAWNAYFNINEPEHWFHITVPTVFLTCFVLSASWLRFALPAWTVATVMINLSLWSIPQAIYPLRRYELDLRGHYAAQDLLIYFQAYRGGPNLDFLTIPGVPRLALDQLFDQSRNDEEFFTSAGREIDTALARGGTVVVFGIFDPYDWNAPWSLFAHRGMTKRKLIGFFAAHYRIVDLGKIAEIPAWQILPP